MPSKCICKLKIETRECGAFGSKANWVAGIDSVIIVLVVLSIEYHEALNIGEF